MFRILNNILPGRVFHKYKENGQAEHMFNMLNTAAKRGKKAAKVCKILDGLCRVCRELRPLFERRRYLVEGAEFSDAVFANVGL